MSSTVKRNSSTSSGGESSHEKKARYEKSDIREWDVEKVSEFLQREDLVFAVDPFIDQCINGAVLFDLNEEDLEKMEIDAIGQRKLILQAIRRLQADNMDITCTRSTSSSPILDTKVFNDPIHGHIEMHPLCVKIIDTPQFQRLRFLKQLGGCYFVFPGASHNRFEHCIGVSHLAGQLVRALRDRQPHLNISDVDILCVEIAGLCHDLGHGPFSHLFDGRFIPYIRPNCTWKHEEASVNMFDYLVEDNTLQPEFERWGLDETDREFIKEQIAGPRQKVDKNNRWAYKGRDAKKSFLYEIVANKRNGIDVDKWDYFARDCHQLGIKNNFDHSRFIKFARVIACEGEMQICTRDKEVGMLYDMFHTRITLHRRAYQHKNKQIVEAMITEALIKADDHIFFSGKDGKKLRMSEAIDDMVAYSKLTDGIFERILYSDDAGLEESRAILAKIQKRELYKCIGQTREGGQKVAREDVNVKAAICSSLSADEQGENPVSPDDLSLQIVSFDYGMKNENPVDHVRFYQKQNPNTGIQVIRDQESLLLPKQFHERFIRLYCKSFDKAIIENATKCFHRWCASNNLTMPKGADLLSNELTPLKRDTSTSKANGNSSSVQQQLAARFDH